MCAASGWITGAGQAEHDEQRRDVGRFTMCWNHVRDQDLIGEVVERRQLDGPSTSATPKQNDATRHWVDRPGAPAPGRAPRAARTANR